MLSLILIFSSATAAGIEKMGFNLWWLLLLIIIVAIVKKYMDYRKESKE